MNYDELLSARDNENGTLSQLMLGKFSKREVEGKFVNVVDVKDKLCCNILFEECLKYECKAVGLIKNQHQLRFMIGGEEVNGDSSMTLVIERGAYSTLAQLLFETPSLVAREKFVDSLISQAFDAAISLNEQNIWHVCFAPRNILIRKGDNQLLLLNHGSFYSSLSDMQELYGDMADFVAPEVLSKGTVDERCDVYSIGKLIESLFSMGDMPATLKRVVKKATRELPEDRYDSVADMRKALNRLQSFRHSLLTAVAAVVIALVVVGAYFGMVPEQNEMEYVKPVPKASVEDLLDDGFDPATELGFIATDTAAALSPEQQKKMEEYEKKAESIFRKRFEREAERILTKVYNSGNMGVGEKKFIVESQKALKELSEVQEEIASQTAISGAKSQRIASEIIEKVSNEKKKAMTQN